MSQINSDTPTSYTALRPPRLLDVVRARIRVKYYSFRSSDYAPLIGATRLEIHFLEGHACRLSQPYTEETPMADPNLEWLMPMVQRVLDNQREMREDVREIKTRLGRLETDVANLHVFIAERDRMR
jgi:hypothetical protein